MRLRFLQILEVFNVTATLAFALEKSFGLYAL